MIFTFYSYKGGVGRSMAVANIAELLYEKGVSVLIIDWDLDSPGLENYFPHISEEARQNPGLLNMIMHYRHILSTKNPQEIGFGLDGRSFVILEREKRISKDILDKIRVLKDQKHETREELINALEKIIGKEQTNQYGRLILKHALGLQFGDLRDFMTDVYPTDEKGSRFLKLLSTGKRDEQYFKKYTEWVKSLDWKDFYDKWMGEQYFEWFRREIEDIAPIILIDSRSGVNEMSGICTKQLADVVIVFTSPNLQSIEGTKKIVEELLEFAKIEKLRPDRSKLNIVVVPARLESTELIARNNFEKKFKDNFDDLLPKNWRKEGRSFWDLRIPYIPLYAFEELVAVREKREKTDRTSQDLVESYEKIWEVMVAKASPPGEEPWRWRRESGRVLIVEDIPQWQDVLKDIVVSRAGKDCELATTRESAISLLKDNEYKLIILNLDLSSETTGITGYEGIDILDHLKATGREIPILLITSGAIPISTRNIYNKYLNVKDLFFKGMGKNLAKDLTDKIHRHADIQE
ncbi:hypothetical protein QUF72_05075 [Desulfobacterales bacterium HSG2]|nr:hypothetical protein [Desulfobacterales bacterium HSG2]